MASFKHMANGKVKITITHGKTFDGKPKKYYKTVEYTTDRQLEVDAALFLADIMNGEINKASSTTIGALFKDFMGTRKDIKPSTADRYGTLYERQIKPYFHTRKVNSLTRPDVRKWVAELLEHGNIKTKGPLAPKTVKNALALLSTLYSHAIYELELVDKNPCEKIKVNNLGKPMAVKEFYTEEELTQMLVLLDKRLDDPKAITHATLIYLILFTGLRTGEIMGLKWDDVNLFNNSIKVVETRVCTATNGIVVGTTKTTSSEREITMPVFISQMLRQLKQHQEQCKEKIGDEWTETNYVSVTIKGTPSHPRNMYDWFKRFLKSNGLKDSTVHDLRHTHAALLTSLGVQIIDISKRLGHSNTRVTQEVYEYLFKNMDNVISLELDNYYKNVAKM